MLNIKIISSDLDGTLLNSDVVISDENKAAIKEYSDRGGLFVPNSGRCLAQLTDEIRALAGVRFLICSDGAVIYDLEKGETLTSLISPEDTLFIVETLKRYECFLMFQFDGVSYVDADKYSEELVEAYNINKNFRLIFKTIAVHKNDIFGFCIDAKDKIELFCPFFLHYDELLECKRILEERGLKVAASMNHLEIISAEAGKGKAVLRLAEHLGIKREETLSVGDSMNDSEMLMMSGLGLAVENSCEGLKAVADEIICDNNSHAVRYIVDKYIREV